MKMEVKRSRIEIVPENEIDEAYIEEVLGMNREGEQCVGVRVNVMGVNVMGTDGLGYIAIRRSMEAKE